MKRPRLNLFKEGGFLGEYPSVERASGVLWLTTAGVVTTLLFFLMYYGPIIDDR